MSFEQFCLDNKIPFKKNEIMKNHTSFKIGGKADYFIECKTAECLKAAVCAARDFGMPYFVLGKLYCHQKMRVVVWLDQYPKKIIHYLQFYFY